MRRSLIGHVLEKKDCRNLEIERAIESAAITLHMRTTPQRQRAHSHNLRSFVALSLIGKDVSNLLTA